ncbi:hypothetical protein ABIB82_003741 [Bradyrhizobium sp. i1.8.4]|uniref:hypothetical protein n=1 Tax=unclassified Bradyrhizobium TaxID=2631580 RepID=UPI003D2113ED
MVYRSLLLLALAVPVSAEKASAQGGPAPFPSNGTTLITPGFPAPSAESCIRDFAPLREDAEMKGRLIKTAAARHAPAAESCVLIRNYGRAEIKMIDYVEANATQCAIPPQIANQLKAGRNNTEALLRKVCAQAAQAPSLPALPVGDFDHLIDRQIP